MVLYEAAMACEDLTTPTEIELHMQCALQGPGQELDHWLQVHTREVSCSDPHWEWKRDLRTITGSQNGKTDTNTAKVIRVGDERIVLQQDVVVCPVVQPRVICPLEQMSCNQRNCVITTLRRVYTFLAR